MASRRGGTTSVWWMWQGPARWMQRQSRARQQWIAVSVFLVMGVGFCTAAAVKAWACSPGSGIAYGLIGAIAGAVAAVFDHRDALQTLRTRRGRRRAEERKQRAGIVAVVVGVGLLPFLGLLPRGVLVVLFAAVGSLYLVYVPLLVGTWVRQRVEQP